MSAAAMPLLGARVSPWHLTLSQIVTLMSPTLEIDGRAIQALEIGARVMAVAPTSTGTQRANSGHLGRQLTSQIDSWPAFSFSLT
jgi:hypothetical protein